MTMTNQADPDGGTMWIHPEQNFKLKFGSKNVFWEAVPMKEDFDLEEEDIEDGQYVTPDGNGKYELAGEGDYPAYPILELKSQYDNQALNAVTVGVGNAPAFTKQFEGDPNVGDHLRVSSDSILEVAPDGEEDLAVARVLQVHGDYIEIQKLI